jgi:hypothetical protein
MCLPEAGAMVWEREKMLFEDEEESVPRNCAGCCRLLWYMSMEEGGDKERRTLHDV